MAASYRRGAILRSRDEAYRGVCEACEAPDGVSCSHKRGRIREALVGILIRHSAQPSMLALHLASDVSLEHALSRAPRYHELLQDAAFREVADLYLAPEGTRSESPVARAACPAGDGPSGSVCAHKHAQLKGVLLDALFPPHYDLVSRFHFEQDEPALRAFLRQHARSALRGEVAFVGDPRFPGPVAVVREGWKVAEVHAVGETALAARLWRCVTCAAYPVTQTAAERCSACGAEADAALIALPEIEDRRYVNTRPVDLGLAEDGIVWLARPQLVVRCCGRDLEGTYDDLDAALAAARRALEDLSAAVIRA